MQKDFEILLDCDGVLADYCRAVHEWIGIPYKPWTSWDGHEEHGIARDKLFEIAQFVSFWKEMPVMSGAKKLLAGLQKIGQVYICTAAVSNPNALYGRAVWLKEQLNIDLDRVIFARHKHVFAHKGSLLIDDHVENVEAFRGRGGQAILVERSYNTPDSDQTTDDILEIAAIKARNYKNA